MFDYTLSSLSERLDTSFLTASLLPAFFAVLGNLGVLVVLVGQDALADWLVNLDSFEETIVAIIIIVIITMVGLLLRALSFVTVAFFVGELFPRSVAAWATHRQQLARTRELRLLGEAATNPSTPPLREQVQRLLVQRYPQDETSLRPTRLGNELATGAEDPWIVYGMDVCGVRTCPSSAERPGRRGQGIGRRAITTARLAQSQPRLRAARRAKRSSCLAWSVSTGQ